MRANLYIQLRRGILLSIFKLLFGLLKIKTLAALLGVEGIGELSVILQFHLFAQTLLSMGLAVVIINLSRPFVVKDKLVESSEVLGTGIFIASLNSILLILSIIVLTRFDFFSISNYFGSEYIWLIVFASIFAAFASVIWESMCFMLDRYDLYVKVNAVVALLDSAIIILGAYTMGFKGIFFGILISAIFQFLIYPIFLFQNISVRKIFKNLSIKNKWISPLYSQGLRMQSIALLITLAPLIARTYILQIYGASVNGQLQVATALSSYLLPFIMNGVWGHLHPLVAAHGNTEFSRKELTVTLAKAIPIVTAISLLILATCQYLLEFFYTKEFLPAKNIVILYFIAEPFYIGFSIFISFMLAIKSYRTSFCLHFLYFIILCSFVFFGNKLFHSESYVFGHIFGSFFVFFIAFFWGLKKNMFSISSFKPIFKKIAVVQILIISYLLISEFYNISNAIIFFTSLLILYNFFYPEFKSVINI